MKKHSQNKKQYVAKKQHKSNHNNNTNHSTTTSTTTTTTPSATTTIATAATAATNSNSTTIENINERIELLKKATAESNVTMNDVPINKFIQDLFGELHKGIRASHGLPKSDSYSFYRATSQPFYDLMEKHAHQIQNSLSTLISKCGFDELEPNDTDDMGHMFETTVDVLDQYYENVDVALDELNHIYNTGKLLNDNNNNNTMNNNNNNNTASAAATTTTTTTSIVRPQLKWKIDNSNTPFVPKLNEKPNASVASLEQSLRRKNHNNGSMDDDENDGDHQESSMLDASFPFQMGIGMGVGGPPTRQSNYHPYEAELLSLEFMDWQINDPSKTPTTNATTNATTNHSNGIQMYKGFNNNSCTWVHTTKDLYQLSALLDGQVDFAIDLEQHSYRTFQGFVCLMQISTREQDYLIDTLELRDHLHVLNSSFTNPKIVKVMHGSDCDILWLQRDFGLYVVNLFDTGRAAQALGLPGLSYAYLLKHYCGVIADKKYQLSDWRIRPLPSEMVKYARQDTHYLLYIYDRLRRDLFDKSPSNGAEYLDDVLKMSRDICLRRYEKELFTETSYLQVVNRHWNRRNNHLAMMTNFNTVSDSSSLKSQQEEIVRILYKWRDTVARKEDESIRFVLPDHMMITIAEQKPTDIQKLMQICTPVPKLVRRDAALLVELIQQAVKLGRADDRLIQPLPSTIATSGSSSVNNTSSQQDEKLSTPMAKNSAPSKHASSLLRASASLSNAVIKTPEVTSRHLIKLESPVLSTDQLYQVAGWIEKPDSTISRLDFSDCEDESGDEKETTEDNDIALATPLTKKQQQNRSVTIRQSSTSSLFFNGGADEEDTDVAMGVNQSVVAEDDDEGHYTKMAEIRNSFSLAQLTSPVKGVHMPPIDTTLATQTITPAQPKRSEPVNNDHSLTPPDERVPSSLNEIYKLSHKNRKRNKQKKKLKQDSDEEEDESSSSRSNGNSRSSSFDSNADTAASDEQGGVSDTKPVDFMKKIGWLGENEHMQDEEEESEIIEVMPQLVIKQPFLGHVQKSRTRTKAYSNKQSNQFNRR